MSRQARSRKLENRSVVKKARGMKERAIHEILVKTFLVAKLTSLFSLTAPHLVSSIYSLSLSLTLLPPLLHYFIPLGTRRTPPTSALDSVDLGGRAGWYRVACRVEGRGGWGRRARGNEALTSSELGCLPVLIQGSVSAGSLGIAATAASVSSWFSLPVRRSAGDAANCSYRIGEERAGVYAYRRPRLERTNRLTGRKEERRDVT